MPEELQRIAATLCEREGCRFKAKYVIDGGHFCGFHKNPPAVRNASKNSSAIVLPKCCGITARGNHCKRNGTKVCGENVYCHSHIPSEHSDRNKLQEDCPICYNSLCSKKNIVSTHCGHLFHKDCITTWRESCPNGDSCPVCRRKTNISRKRPSKIQRIYTTIEVY